MILWSGASRSVEFLHGAASPINSARIDCTASKMVLQYGNTRCPHSTINWPGDRLSTVGSHGRIALYSPNTFLTASRVLAEMKPFAAPRLQSIGDLWADSFRRSKSCYWVSSESERKLDSFDDVLFRREFCKANRWGTVPELSASCVLETDSISLTRFSSVCVGGGGILR